MEEKVTPEYVVKYFKDKLGENDPDPKAIENIFNTMKKYEDNHWWNLEDKAMIGYYQLMEGTLVVNFRDFHEGLGKLLDRPVWTHEMGLNWEGLKEEAQEAMGLYIAGIKHSDEYRQEKTKESINMIEDYCKKNNKGFLKLDLSKEQNDEDNGRDENGIDKSGYDRFLE